MREDQAPQPAVILVAAVAANGVIGRDGELPWRIAADMRHFKRMTLGKPVIMGRKTFESLGRALPERRNIVITRRADWSAPGAERAESLDAALAMAADAPEIAVIGGAEIYALALPVAHRLELTEVQARPDGDTVFPGFDRRQWREIRRDDHPPDGETPGFSFITLERCGPRPESAVSGAEA